jgi:hypothetical protein
MRNKLYYGNSSAFTLVEMAISLSIIALLVGGITVGDYLINQSRLRSVIKEIDLITTSIRAFKMQYGYLPGDFPNATTIWPSGSTANGNGNGVIESATNNNTPLEDTYVFQQLYLANIINFSLSGGAQGGGTNRYVVGGNAYPSKIPATGYFIAYGTSLYGIANTSITHQLQFGGATNSTNGVLNGQAVTSSDAYYIDQKMDDGVPSNGNVATARAIVLDATANTCVSAAIATAPPITYVLTDSTVSCRMFILLTEFN